MKNIYINFSMTFDISRQLTGSEDCFEEAVSDDGDYRIDNHTAGRLAFLTIIGEFNEHDNSIRRHFFVAEYGKFLRQMSFKDLEIPFSNWLERHFLGKLVKTSPQLIKDLANHLNCSSLCADPEEISPLSRAHTINIGDNEILFTRKPKIYLWRTFLHSERISHKITSKSNAQSILRKMEKLGEEPIESQEYSLLIGVNSN